MLVLLRLLSILVGAATAWRVLDGTITQPLFKTAYFIAGTMMVIGALMPNRVVPNLLGTANAYALGAFSCALASSFVPGRPADPLLMAAMAVNLATILLLFPRGGGHH